MSEKREDGMPASAAERHLRRMLCVWSGMSLPYMDDGEAQAEELGVRIDFMRDDPAVIERKLRAIVTLRYHARHPHGIHPAAVNEAAEQREVKP